MNIGLDAIKSLSVPRPLWSGKPIVGVVIVGYIPECRCLLIDSADKSVRYMLCNQEFYDEVTGYPEFNALNLPVYDKEKIEDILVRFMERDPLNPVPMDTRFTFDPFKWW